MRVITSCLLLTYCCCNCAAAFSVAARKNNNNYFRPSLKSPLFVLKDPTDQFLPSAFEDHDDEDVFFSSSSAKNKSNKKDDNDSSIKAPPHSLDLDEEHGRLVLDGTQTLIDGLGRDSWRASRPPGNDQNGLFLHYFPFHQNAQHDATLGDLVSCSRLLACSRLTRYWMGPACGTSAEDVPFDTQFLLLEIEENGPYALLLPLVDGGFRTSLHSSSKIELVSHTESGDDSVVLGRNGMRALHVSVSDNPFELLQSAFQQVSKATGTFETLKEKQLPKSVDEFGWCTWDAFYSKVTPEGVLKGVKALNEAGVPPRTLILDDGWQQVSPSPPDWNTNTKENKPKKKLFSASTITAPLASVFAKSISALYEVFVRKAHHGTLPNAIWRTLCQTSFWKSQLWNFFDSSTDFGRQLSGFDPNLKFNNLQELVSTLKQDYGLHHVYCWHALHGYWRGVSPELGSTVKINVTNVFPKPSSHMLQVEPQLAWDPVSLFGVGLLDNSRDLQTFYQLLHEPLVKAGIDGVKVDVQSGVSAVGGGVGGGPHLARIYTEAMEESVSKKFSKDGAASCINCMCHSTENLYRYKTTAVARASDDFYPRRSNSHTVHLVNVAYNSLFIGEICLPDWDMFHSKHESASLHAAARAIGGCPVYVSDEPGDHDADLLKKLVLPDGSVLRAKLPGRPTRDCLFCDVGQDGTSALKIWNENAHGGVVGAFHVQGVAWNFDTHENEVINASPPPLTATVKPRDVEGLRGMAGPFAAYSHRSSKLTILATDETPITAKLNHREWEIFTIVPVQTSDNGKIVWAPIGLADMLNSGGAVLEAGQLEQIVGSEGRMATRAQLTSRGPGHFVAYCQPAPLRVLVGYGDDTVSDLLFTHDEANGMLSFDLPNEREGRPHQVTVLWE